MPDIALCIIISDFQSCFTSISSLTLPETLKTTDLKWLSVWCRAFRVNFGDMSFPENLVSDAEIPDEMPPPLIEPIHNAHDPNRHDDDWKEDADAEQGATTYLIVSKVLAK